MINLYLVNEEHKAGALPEVYKHCKDFMGYPLTEPGCSSPDASTKKNHMKTAFTFFSIAADVEDWISKFATKHADRLHRRNN